MAGLDPGLRERILPWLLRVRDAWNLPCLYVTHNVGEALAVASHLVVLREGRVEEAGAPRALLSTPAVVDEAAEGLENLLPGHVLSHDTSGGITRVRTEAGFDVSITLAADQAVGRAVTLTVRSEDVLVCAAKVEGLSARNVYPARVASLERTGPDVVLRGALDNGGGELMARVTPAAVSALDLAPDRRVWLAVKSHSIRIV
jgi:molybdate transport system ATP-binding protein